MTVAVRETLTIPQVDWLTIRGRINRYWEAREAPHISIMAQTRAGKTYLVRHGLLPLTKWDRVLILDFKGDDPTMRGLGRPVREIPGKLRSLAQLTRDKEPGENWFRLVAHKNFDEARDQIGTALERVYDEGDWVVVTDELRALTDTQPPGLRLRWLWERMILRGGSRGLATVNLSQEPRWCPGSFYTQSNFYFFSRLEDEATHKRIA